MKTIKGPIKFNNFNSKEFLSENSMKIKLPFTATGFKATNIPKEADLEGIELKE